MREEGRGTREEEGGRRDEGEGRREEEGRRHFGARGAHALCRRSKITSLQAGPERASEQPIWGDLEAFWGRRRPQALLEVQSHEFAGRLGKGIGTTDFV